VRLFRTGGIAAVAMLIALALFGASAASGTSICKEKVEVCPEAKAYPAGTVFHLTQEAGGSVEFTVLGIKCEASTMVDVLVGGGNPFYNEVTTWTFAKCKSSSGPECTVTTDNTPLTSEIEFKALNPTVVLAKLKGGSPRITVKCPLLQCTYGAEKVVLDFEGGTPARWIAKEEELKREEGPEATCGSATKMSAKYVITEAKIGKEVFKTPPVFVTE
jgi:hypothetical protein